MVYWTHQCFILRRKECYTNFGYGPTNLYKIRTKWQKSKNLGNSKTLFLGGTEVTSKFSILIFEVKRCANFGYGHTKYILNIGKVFLSKIPNE